MKDLDIRNAYDQFDRDGDGELTASEVAEALKNIGVDMPVLEIRELVYDVGGCCCCAASWLCQ